MSLYVSISTYTMIFQPDESSGGSYHNVNSIDSVHIYVELVIKKKVENKF